MKYKELQAILTSLEEKYERDTNEAIREFCDTNNSYKKGDVFTDHIGSIRIEHIGYAYGIKAPCCIFTGVEVKKDGSPRKYISRRTCYQSNDAKVDWNTQIGEDIP